MKQQENSIARAQGKVAVVSGGSQGIGAAHVRRLVREGAKVMITDILVDEGQALASEYKESATFLQLDVRDKEQWNYVIEETEKKFGKVTTLVNNAGIIDGGNLETFSEAAYRHVIDINQIGTFLGMQAVILAMKRAGGGSIVNCSSIQGLAGTPGLIAYVSSKFAITGMTKVAALELAAFGIRVNSLHPGFIATPMTDGVSAPDKQPINRMGTPEEMAALMLFLISDESSFCTGSEFVADGGLLSTALVI